MLRRGGVGGAVGVGGHSRARASRLGLRGDLAGALARRAPGPANAAASATRATPHTVMDYARVDAHPRSMLHWAAKIKHQPLKGRSRLVSLALSQALRSHRRQPHARSRRRSSENMSPTCVPRSPARAARPPTIARLFTPVARPFNDFNLPTRFTSPAGSRGVEWASLLPLYTDTWYVALSVTQSTRRFYL